MYQCVIFDMDGTLIDSFEGIYHSYEWAMKKMNWPFEGEPFVRRVIGAPLPEVFHNICKMDASETGQAILYYRAFYQERGKKEAVLYEGMEKTLQKLKGSGCFVGVATMKKEQFAEEILEMLQVRSYFDAVCGADEENRLSKRDLILKCLELSGYKKEEAILVGDSKYDGEGAKEAGIDFLAAMYGFGFSDVEVLRAAGARACVQSAGEVGDWILGENAIYPED